MGVPEPVILTVDDWYETPDDGRRYEILDGKLLVTPTPVPHHQRVLWHLATKVGLWAETRKLGRWYQSPCGVMLSNTTVLEPDAFFIRADRLVQIVGPKLIEGAPDLVVEVLSPSTARRDRTLKRDAYAAHGIPEYWLVATDAQVVTVLGLVGSVYEEIGLVHGDALIPSRVLPDLTVRAAEIFED